MASVGLGDTLEERLFFGASTGLLDRARQAQGEARRMAGKLLRATTLDDAEVVMRCERIATWSRRLGRELRLDAEELLTIELGALLHDIGATRETVGHPMGLDRGLEPTLTHVEMTELIAYYLHPERGAEMLAPIAELRRAIPIVRAHHERFDGTGFPRALRGEEIPLHARIVHVADAYEAMTSGRAPHRAMTHDEARAEIGRRIGRRFDPVVFEALCRIPRAEWVDLCPRVRG